MNLGSSALSVVGKLIAGASVPHAMPAPERPFALPLANASKGAVAMGDIVDFAERGAELRRRARGELRLVPKAEPAFRASHLFEATSHAPPPHRPDNDPGGKE